MQDLEQEHFIVLVLNARNRVIKKEVVYHGSLNTQVIRVAEVFRPAIKENGAAIIIAHNHPSSDPSPSPEDIAVTRTICRVGKEIDIALLDHLIIGRQRYTSLKDRGLGFDV
jgi:DNA repair protein RadC